MLSAQSQVLNIAQGVLARAGDAVQLNQFAPELAAPVERLPFNVTCFGPQKFAFADVPLAEIKAVKNACETTVNDVILTVVTLAIRRYAELHGVDVKDRRLRVVVPVNVRDSSNQNELGNRISFIPLSVPLDARDPKELLAAVRERMVFLKGAQAAELVGLAGSLLGMAPLPLQAVVWPVVSQLPISVCNTIITNVPGPQVPLYLLGHKMLRWYPYVPIGGEMGVNIAVLTYDGTAYFGFTGDVKAAPDLERFEEFLRESFAELKAAAGLKPAPRKRARARGRGARKAKAAAAPPIAPVVTMPEPPAPPAEEITATEEPKKALAAKAG
jgi:diacylglycerol O-acyltransferase